MSSVCGSSERPSSILEDFVTIMVTACIRHDVQAYPAKFADDLDFTNVFGILTHGPRDVSSCRCIDRLRIKNPKDSKSIRALATRSESPSAGE
jgi:hypothetical protein